MIWNIVYEFSMTLFYLSSLLNSTSNSTSIVFLNIFLRSPFSKWKIITFYFQYVQILCALFTLRPSFEINSIKIQRMTLVLDLFWQIIFVFYLLWHHHSPATEKKVQASWTFFSHANEVKTCGLVQQLILRMLRDLIL